MLVGSDRHCHLLSCPGQLKTMEEVRRKVELELKKQKEEKIEEVKEGGKENVMKKTS